MAEENAAAESEKKSSGMLSQIILLLVVVLVSTIGGALTYKFVLGPMFEEGPAKPPPPTVEDPIPAAAVMYKFEPSQTGVIAKEGESPAVLMYQISFACANAATYAIIEANLDWFVAMLSDLHLNKTKTEVTDPAFKRGIEKQALREANSLLRRLQEEVDPDIKVIEVLHVQFAAIDI